ncbi:outer membrane beta-barrel protein [Marinobacter sp. M-5]|uniref:outer membrane beta-barrel protein n=1 Tax=Marinobacter sp. M-5 TaxID=3081089 RepID=UPI00293D0DC4|nr:outer membrane beta-barrel protein [Marinobacter sp. M-5]MDV3502213.1 outer membrane beta-barrel protein [Marinobacter sp. M-5]
MNYKASISCATVLTTAVFAAPAAWAQDNTARDSSGFFISGSYGGYKSHGGEFDDDNDLLGASVGYKFNEFFALEADYIDFGNFGDDDVEGKLKGVGLGLIGRLPLTDTFGVYAKAGAFASALDVDAFDESETYDEVSPFVGAGVDFRVTEQLTAFAEYDRYNVDIDEDDFNGQVTNDGPDFDTGRVGVRFQF